MTAKLQVTEMVAGADSDRESGLEWGWACFFPRQGARVQPLDCGGLAHRLA